MGALAAPDRDAEIAAALDEARTARARGDRDRAVCVIERQLQAGTWRRSRLWAERVSLMDSPQEYEEIRDLWLKSPKRTHSSVPILRSVARAAALAGHHDDARALLRKAIREEDRRWRGQSAVLARRRTAAAAAVARWRWGSPAPDDRFEHLAAEAMADFESRIAALGERTFLVAGTVLGLVRDGGFIAWDKDIDVGVFAEETSMPQLVAGFEQDRNFAVKRLDFTSLRLRVNHVNSAAIDVFLHYKDVGRPGRLWHDGAATRWWNTPFELAPVSFLGRTAWIPDNPEHYLEESYGDWRTPDSAFDARLDAPNVEITDQEYFDTLLYFSLLTAIRQGKTVKRDRYAALLRELGEGSWVERVGR